MLIFFSTILVLEIYKHRKGRHCWEFCYNMRIPYSYSEFLLYELFTLKKYIFVFILFCYIFYIILILNLFMVIFFIIKNKKIKKSNIIINIFLYAPYLTSLVIKKTIKNVKIKKILKILYINYINIILYGFPRITMDYSFTSTKILRSFLKNPNITILSYKDLLLYIYNNTINYNIDRMESFLKYPI